MSPKQIELTRGSLCNRSIKGTICILFLLFFLCRGFFASESAKILYVWFKKLQTILAIFFMAIIKCKRSTIIEKIILYFLNLCRYYSVRMSICGKLQGASVVFLVEGAIAKPAGKGPISRLFRRLVSSLKVARSHSRVLSLCLYPVDPVVLTALPTVSLPSLDLQHDRYSISCRIMSFHECFIRLVEIRRNFVH